MKTDKQEVKRLLVGKWDILFSPYLSPEKQRKNQEGQLLCLCPFHDDKEPSLSINTQNGVFRCFGCEAKGDGFDFLQKVKNCTFREALQEAAGKVGLKGSPVYKKKTEITVSQLAKDKNIPEEFLRNQMGLKEKDGGVLIPYLDIEGEPTLRQRKRTSLLGKKGSTWFQGKESIGPYGIWDLPKFREVGKNYLILVEGESDVWTLWFNRFPAIGLPGANMAGKLKHKHLTGFEIIYVWKEPDQGGETFAKKIPARLQELEFNGRMLIIESQDAKDPSELYQKDPKKFKENLKEIFKKARPSELGSSERKTANKEGRKRDEDDEGKKINLATQIVRTVEPDLELFTDERYMPFATMPIEDHRETWAIRSQKFKNWLQKVGTDINEGKIPYKEAISQAKDQLEALCSFNGKTRKLYNRIGKQDDAYWYDLTDEKWRAVKITEEGFEVVNNPPILFRRANHQKPQFEPKKGDPWKLLDFTNIKEEKDKLLIMVYLVSCFIPDIPHPIPIIHGTQGSAKSTLMEFLRMIIDPSQTPLLRIPRNEKDIVQTFDHHYATSFDNVSVLPGWLSDVFCRAVTGEGSEFRALFTDHESVIRSYKRCLAMTGINVAATRSDLLDRSILIELEPIKREDRKELAAIKKEFKEELPGILGGVFETLSKAIRKKKTLSLSGLPRMADFAAWGYVIAEALGKKGENFLNAYNEDEEERSKEAVTSNPLGGALMKFLEDRDTWEGSPGELLKALEDVSEEEGIKTNSKYWPGSPTWLSRRLNEFKPNLSKQGIEFKRERGKTRNLIFRNSTRNSVDSVDSVEKGAEASNNTLFRSDAIKKEGNPKKSSVEENKNSVSNENPDMLGRKTPFGANDTNNTKKHTLSEKRKNEELEEGVIE